MNAFSDFEDKTIKSVYPVESKEEILRLLPGRKWSAIQKRASHLKIHRYKDLDRVIEYRKTKLSDLEIGWLAGALDGEGSLNFSERKDGLNKYYMHIQIANTNLAYLQKAKEIIHAGSIYSYNWNNGKWKIIYTYRLTNVGIVLHILEQITPYLIIKKEKAEIITKACEDILNHVSRSTDWTLTYRYLNEFKKTQDPEKIRRQKGGLLAELPAAGP